MNPQNEIYLGDGLYASFDGYSFILRAARSDGDHWVALEPDMIRTLVEYIERSLREAVERRNAHLGKREQPVDAADVLRSAGFIEGEAMEDGTRTFSFPEDGTP